MSGENIRRSFLSTEQMLEEALVDDSCECINSLGFFKPLVRSVGSSKYMQGQQDGLYIKVSAWKRLERDDPKLFEFIRVSCVPLETQCSIRPMMVNSGFWMPQHNMLLKHFHVNNLETITLINNNGHIEGHMLDGGLGGDILTSNTSHSKQFNISRLASTRNRILEIGFNAGYSCLLMLLANPECHITLVDLNYHRYVVPCFEYLNAQFPGRL